MITRPANSVRRRCVSGRAVLLCGLGLMGGCGTPLPKAPPQPYVGSLPPATTGVLADVTTATRDSLGPDTSGFLLIPRSRDALTWRLALVEHATSSLDAMYFIWQSDPTGVLLFNRILAAADRGVRVRLIVDDLPLATSDRSLAALCLHPNVDIKIFNPIALRTKSGWSTWEFIFGLRQYNRRMHNKLFVADNHVAIVGGRNIGDEYFGLARKYNFRDLDAVVTGVVVEDLSASFDSFWNSDIAYPAALLSDRERPKHLERIRVNQHRFLQEKAEKLQAYPIEPTVWAKELRELPARMVGGDAQVVQDAPVSVDGEEVRVADLLRHLTEGTPTQHELLISTPYMIPTGSFLENLRKESENGVDVKLITGSLGSNNHTPAHSFYRKYRKQILRNGADLYEFHHEPSEGIREEVDVPPVRARFISNHTKALVGDRERCFIGSLNLDPRALDLNTENGLYIESPALGAQLAALIEESVAPDTAWHVTMDDDARVSWTSDRGTVYREPARSWWQRVKAFFFRLLPIEKQI